MSAKLRGKTLNGQFKLNSRLVIQRLREKPDIYRYISESLAVSNATATRWLQRDTVPAVDHLVKLADLCGVKTNDLLLPLVG